MGFVEAFAIGGAVGGVGAILLFVVLARGARGRSTTAFVLPGWTSAQVLQAAQSYFPQRGLQSQAMAEGIRGEEGSVWMTGVRVLEVRVKDRAGGGVDVRIDAYIRGMYPKEIHLDPGTYFGMIPKRKALASRGASRGRLELPSRIGCTATGRPPTARTFIWGPGNGARP